MNLNELDISQVILDSRKKFSFKRLFFQNLLFWGSVVTIGATVCANLSMSLPPAGFWIGVTACSTLKLFTETFILNHKIQRANRQLVFIAKSLEKDGICVSRLKLKKAELGQRKAQLVHGSYGISCITETEVVFKDNSQQIRALKQVRSELLQKVREPNSQDIREASYIEVIEDSSVAAKILAKIKRR